MLAVLFLDLDRFKHINDSRGHEVGDKLLQEIAKRVRAAVRPADIVVRMGGDEFVVVLHRVNAPDEVAGAATRINEVLSAPVMIDGRALVATVSIGVSLFPRDGATMGELLKHSDTAMYQAKDLGRNNFQVFSPQMDRTLKERVAIESSLARRAQAAAVRRALPAHHRHPLRAASPGSRRCCAGNIPTQGYVSPERFIEVAEETGLIIPIGQFVLDRVGRDITALARAGRAPGAGQHERLGRAAGAHQAARADAAGHGEVSASDRSCIALELTEGSLFETRTGEFREDALASCATSA